MNFTKKYAYLISPFWNQSFKLMNILSFFLRFSYIGLFSRHYNDGEKSIEIEIDHTYRTTAVFFFCLFSMPNCSNSSKTNWL